jgi:dTDP-4-amino-4,6-dideoxygalactose transaminase
LADEGLFELPYIPDYATNNAHMFYLVCCSLDERTKLIQHLKNKGIQAVFHYLSLHTSPFYNNKHEGRTLPKSDRFADCLVRLPFYYDLSESDLEYICEEVKRTYLNSNI